MRTEREQIRQRRRVASPRRRATRRGLAPLELVLSIPLLLMAMAMMIIVGTAGSWKVRTLANSRHAAHRSLWPRNGAGEGNPDNWWPASAAMSFDANAAPNPFSVDPFAEHYVVRGPFVPATNGGRPLQVKLDTLDMRQQLVSGYAEIDRDLPMWQQLPVRNKYRRDTQVFAGDQWQHGSMGIANVSRRILVTYEYDLGRYDPGAMQNMMAAASALLANPERPNMFLLDRDGELRGWYGDPYVPYSQDRYDWLSFYPPVARGCDLDLRPHVDALLERIEDVPRNMANRHLRMYQEQLRLLPPNDPRRGPIEEKIQQLQDFLGTLP